MTTLFIDRKGLSLRADSSALAFYDENGRVGTVPLNILERVCIRGDIQLSASVLGKLGEHGAGVVILSGKKRQAVLLMPNYHTDALRRRAQYQLAADNDFSLHIAKQWLSQKINGQLALLQQHSTHNAHLNHHINIIRQSLEALNQTTGLSETIGLEGIAAAHYFNGLRHILPSSLEFDGRNRRPPKDPFNAVLSLGYTLLHFEWGRHIHLCGLDPMAGFLHQPYPGRESLACDLLETLRPQYDEWAVSLFSDGTLRPEDFNSSNGRCEIGKSGRQRFYRAYENTAKTWRPQMHRTIMDLIATMGAACAATDQSAFQPSEWQSIDNPPEAEEPTPCAG